MSTCSQKIVLLVEGYCHENTTKYVPSEIIQLFIIYCKLNESFGRKYIGNTIQINGSNDNKLNCIKDEFSTVFGTNIIKPNSGSHHWKFLLTIDETIEASYTYSIQDWYAMIGFIKDQSDNLNKVKNSHFTSIAGKAIAYIVNIGYSTTNNHLQYAFGSPLFRQGQHSIDLYIDTSSDGIFKNKFVLFINGMEHYGHQRIDFGQEDKITNYRLAVSLSNEKYHIQLLQYDNSLQFKQDKEITSYIGYAESIRYGVIKQKYLKLALQDTNCEYVDRLYIEALMANNDADGAYWHVRKCNFNGIDATYDVSFIIAMIGLALNFYCKNEYDKALNIYGMMTDEIIIKYNVIWKVAISFHKQHSYDDALRFYKIFLETKNKTDKEIADCLANMALLYDYKNSQKVDSKNIDEAIIATKRALEYNPNDCIAYNNLGYFYMIKHEYDESYKCLQKSYDINPNATLINGNMGNLLYAMNKLDQAMPFLKKSFDVAADCEHPEVGPKALHNYSKILYLKQKYKKSIEYAKKLIQRKDFIKYDSKDHVYMLISYGYDKLYEYQLAMEYAVKAQKIAPRNGECKVQIKKLRYKM